MEIFNIENLSFKYSGCDEKAIEDVSLSIKKDEFIVLCGATGSGKSTLLKMLKRELTPLGELTGDVYFKNKKLNELTAKESVSSIGFVMQRPEHQIVTDKVWHELAFGLENLNVPKSKIAARIAETSCFFGIENWYERNVSELSGGQKQLLNLAAVMVMQPEVLILDEPLSQLDPIAASEFVAMLKKINTELSTTIIIAEHSLEEIIPLCDKLVVMEKGSVLFQGSAGEVISKLKNNSEIMCAMPLAAQLFNSLNLSGECPLTVKKGRKMIENNFENKIRLLPNEDYHHSKNKALEFKDVFFRYERNGSDILKLDFSIYENEIFFILGGNGSGKTTTLSVAAGIYKPYSGKIKVFGKKINDYKNQSLYRNCLALLPQDVQTMFLKNTVKEELEEFGKEIDFLFDFTPLYNKHPYDLSGGQQQLLGLAKVLALKPKLLLLDEPTKGLDAYTKKAFSKILKKLKENGITIVAVTHDIEFAAVCADRCALFFKGNIVSQAPPTEIFSENHFYTTAASRMTRGFFDNAVTMEQTLQLCAINAGKGGETYDGNQE